jgi:hypothetical protein
MAYDPDRPKSSSDIPEINPFTNRPKYEKLGAEAAGPHLQIGEMRGHFTDPTSVAPEWLNPVVPDGSGPRGGSTGDLWDHFKD